jgi:hypothetical protein
MVAFVSSLKLSVTHPSSKLAVLFNFIDRTRRELKPTAAGIPISYSDIAISNFQGDAVTLMFTEP